MARFLRYGLSTGACAAAAAKAAVMALMGASVDKVVIPTPIGIRFEIPVKESKKLGDAAVAVVVKDAGDDIDVTDKLEIYATVRLTEDGKVTVKGAAGVGVVTKPGLPVPVGESAINPVPRSMIIAAVKEALPSDKGAEVVISVPAGEEVAKKTLNSRLGIAGGISILGTTGVVKPLSLEACKRSLVPQIDIALAKGYDHVFLVPGNIGERITKKLFNVADEAIIQTGDFMGYMLDKASEKGIKEITILGHPGKLVKLAAGIFNTHHRVADARSEVIAAYAASVGADSQLVNKILASNTTEEAVVLLREANLLKQTFDKIAGKVAFRVLERVKNKMKVNVILVSMEGAILGTWGNIRSA
ncbi:MAG: cobalt-precorrin-5B (C(1))-methyltransferase CbiD [Candidatus Bathyarchaeota archaeon]|nr:cobalt-precorrin-5B (C(1))-methyltransferase CbiD [Candidatus Bathyarchaeota archaeon]